MRACCQAFATEESLFHFKRTTRITCEESVSSPPFFAALGESYFAVFSNRNAIPF